MRSAWRSGVNFKEDVFTCCCIRITNIDGDSSLYMCQLLNQHIRALRWFRQMKIAGGPIQICDLTLES